MGEREWLACVDPRVMLDRLVAGNLTRGSNPASPRKLRLALAACCRRVFSSLGHFGRAAVEAAERVADGELPPSVLEDRRRAADQEAAESQRFSPGNRANFAAAWLCGDLANPDEVLRACATAVMAPAPFNTPQYDAERAAQATVLREVFGSPFRAYAWTDSHDCRPSGHELQFLDRRWLRWEGGTVPKLAEGIHDGRHFDRLPVLADALEEAGCTSAELLGHLRGPGPHVRGCWCLDLILGKG